MIGMGARTGAIGLAALGASLVAAPVTSAGWSAPQDLRATGSLFYPHVAIDARGDGVVAWIAQDGRVRAALSRSGGRFGSARVIGRAGGPNLPLKDLDVAMRPDGDAIVLWAQQSARPPHFRIEAAVAAGARRFSPAALVGASTTALRAHPQLALARHGEAIAGWHRDDVGLQLAVQRGSGGFGRPQTPLILPDTDVAWAPAPDGRLHLAWTAAGPEGSYVAYASGRLGGRWSMTRPLSASGRSAPVLAAAPNDSLLAAFLVGQPGEGETVGAVEARTSAPGRTLDVPSGVQALAPEGVSARELRLAVGAHGQAAVSWRGAVFAPQHGVAAWIALRPAGGAFAPAQPLAATDALALAPAAAFDGSRTVTVATVQGDAVHHELDIRRGAPGALLPAPGVVARCTEPAPTAIEWSSASVAAAGARTVVAWSMGTGGPIRLFSYR